MMAKSSLLSPHDKELVRGVKHSVRASKIRFLSLYSEHQYKQGEVTENGIDEWLINKTLPVQTGGPRSDKGRLLARGPEAALREMLASERNLAVQ